MGTGRVQAFSDGVIAIIITIESRTHQRKSNCSTLKHAQLPLRQCEFCIHLAHSWNFSAGNLCRGFSHSLSTSAK